MVNDFVLSVEGLTVSFDGFKAVDDLSFYVERDEVRAIIGPNGAGKTTVLDLISGRTRASRGSVSFGGKELTSMREHQIVRAGVMRTCPHDPHVLHPDLEWPTSTPEPDSHSHPHSHPNEELQFAASARVSGLEPRAASFFRR
jgi:ABC-type dipeptide/oligopeptide/nickel transport system ATPase subunit